MPVDRAVDDERASLADVPELQESVRLHWSVSEADLVFDRDRVVEREAAMLSETVLPQLVVALWLWATLSPSDRGRALGMRRAAPL